MEGETRFFSYNKPGDWATGESFNLESNDDGVFIRQTEKYAVRNVIRLNQLEGAGEIYDFTIGRAGRLYLLDEHAAMWMYDVENAYHEVLFRPGHDFFSRHASIVSVGDNVFIADADAERKLAAYSLSNGQTLWTISEWNQQSLSPLAIASDFSRHIYVLVPIDTEVGSDSKLEIPDGGRFAVLKFRLSGELAAVYTDEKFVLKQRTKVHHLKKCFYLAISSEETIFVFDTTVNALYAFAAEGELISRIFLPSFQFSGLTVDRASNIYIGDSRNISDEGEDDRFILNFGLTGELIAKVSGFRGKTDKLLLDRRNRMYVLNRENETMTLLELLPRTLEMEWTGVLQGVFLSTAIDSTVPETIWHRIVLDADIPDETQIRVSYYSSDTKKRMISGMLLDLDDFIKDPERHSFEKLWGLDEMWSKPLINPRDGLLHAKGRYLWIKIELIGSEQKTPLLKKLRILYPRTSFVSYLPAMYQDDHASNDFLERFLSLFGTLFEQVEDKIQQMPRYLDTDTATGTFLQWLGMWVGIEVDDNWTEEQLRRLIREAPALYRKRGTRECMEKMIEIYLNDTPFIIEQFQLKAMRDIAEWKELANQLYGQDPYQFTVIVKPECVDTEKKRVLLQKIMDEQKPANTEARLVTLQPWIYLDMHSYLGVNTCLSDPSLLSLDPRLSMPNDTLLIDFGVDRRMDIHTRLEIDSEME